MLIWDGSQSLEWQEMFGYGEDFYIYTPLFGKWQTIGFGIFCKNTLKARIRLSRSRSCLFALDLVSIQDL